VEEHYLAAAVAVKSARSSRVTPSDDALPFRTAPHNLEAEQALLGAILVNNAAHDHVSGFLEPHHFYDPLHQQIYETAAKLITSGKQATPITLKTFFEKAEPIDAHLTVPQYLGRLAANATTIINARDYAQTIRNLWTRRQLILIGEDMALPRARSTRDRGSSLPSVPGQACPSHR
jgi:replicative DNA helicase